MWDSFTVLLSISKTKMFYEKNSIHYTINITYGLKSLKELVWIRPDEPMHLLFHLNQVRFRSRINTSHLKGQSVTVMFIRQDWGSKVMFDVIFLTTITEFTYIYKNNFRNCHFKM